MAVSKEPRVAADFVPGCNKLVLRNHADGVEHIAQNIRSFGERADVREAIAVLQRDFVTADSVGAVRVAEFLGGPDDDLQADVAGFVRTLLASLP